MLTKQSYEQVAKLVYNISKNVEAETHDLTLIEIIQYVTVAFLARNNDNFNPKKFNEYFNNLKRKD